MGKKQTSYMGCISAIESVVQLDVFYKNVTNEQGAAAFDQKD